MIRVSWRTYLKLRFSAHLKSEIFSRIQKCNRRRTLSDFRCEFSTQIEDEEIPVERIRNFSIIAHVDHGKSTLADRILEITGAITKSKENKQVLDRLPVERERGITVKAVAASLNYTYGGTVYHLNLIDTPGHVDFSNEVSRSLSACQGVILLVDANEGIQAQTVANFYLAFGKDLTIIPVLNKIDLPGAKPEVVENELKTVLDIDPSTVKRVSAKTGQGVEDLLKSVIDLIPPPLVRRDNPFKALVIDSWYDQYRGSVLFVSVADGEVRIGDEVTSHKKNRHYLVKTVGKLKPEEEPVKVLRAGEVGVVTCNMKDSTEVFVGDTIFAKGKDVGFIPAVPTPTPMIFAALFPRNQGEIDELQIAIEKLLLNDSSVTKAPETSPVLGSGWRLGFLGYLHLDVFRQRLEQEYGKEVILTSPSVTYKVKIHGAKNIKKYNGDEIFVKNPIHFPDRTAIKEMFEPMSLATIITPIEYYQSVIDECIFRRGIEKETTELGNNRIMMKIIIPLNEIIIDFHDTLKGMTSGYATFDYEDYGYASSSLDRLVILLNGKEVEELVQIVHSSRTNSIARRLVEKLKEKVPRQQVGIIIQAVVGGKILAREDIKPYRKDVLQKLKGVVEYSRKKKLLQAQAEGKKKMRKFFNLQIPRDIFIEVLKEK